MNRISSFIQFETQEKFDREYFIAHTSLKRFHVSNIIFIFLGWCCFILPGIILLAYYSLRKLKISYGYATVTNKRVLYYEYSDHVAVNYHFVKSLYLSDITAVQFHVERTLLRKSFAMAVYTEFKALEIGARGWIKILSFFSKTKYLEPGPDALDFIQYLSGQVSLAQFQPDSASKPALA